MGIFGGVGFYERGRRELYRREAGAGEEKTRGGCGGVRGRVPAGGVEVRLWGEALLLNTRKKQEHGGIAVAPTLLLREPGIRPMHRPPVGISDSNTTTLSVTICPFRYRVNRFRTYSCRKIKTALQQPRIGVPGLDRGIHAFLGGARRSLLLSSSPRKPGPIVDQHSAAKCVPAFAGTTEERVNSN